jgi:1-acyl-sn-glycerol-3-phosphate acyltransferase
MRAAWSFCCIIAITAYHALRAILLAVIGADRGAGGRLHGASKLWARHLVRATALDVTAAGLERLEPGRAYVYVSNHASFVDIWVLLACLPPGAVFIAKRSLLHIPILGAALRATGQIPLDRASAAAAALAYDAAARDVRGGRSVIVFAEGTRSRTGRLQPFKKGAFVLAIAAGVPLVPAYLEGTYAAMPRGTLWIRRRGAPVRLTLAPPIPTSALRYEDRDRLLADVRAWFDARAAAVDAIGGGG